MQKRVILFLTVLFLIFTSMTSVFANNSFSEQEPNDSFERANSINPNQEVSGTFSNEEDNDYYKLTLPYKGQLNLISVFGEYSSYYHQVEIYDSNWNFVNSTYYDYYWDEEDSDWYEYQSCSLDLQKGTYYLVVKYTDDYELDETDYVFLTEVEYEADFTIKSLTASPSSPQTVGKEITIKADSEKSGLEYQISIDGKVVKSFNSTNSYKWLPNKSGKYKIKAEARDPQNPSVTVSKEISFEVKDWTPDFTITSLTASRKSPQIAGQAVKFTATASKSGLEYQFSINGSVVQSFGKGNTYTWTPSVAKNNEIKVEVRNPAYPNSIVTKKISHEVKSPNVKITYYKPHIASPYPTNKTVKWTVEAEGVDLEYKFSVYLNKKWKTVQNYSSKTSLYWKPKTAGTYKVKVEVRSKASGKTSAKETSYKIFKPSKISISRFYGSAKSPQVTDKYIKFTAKAKGSYIEYRFRIHNGYDWYTYEDWSKYNTLWWSPYYKGKYKIAVDIRQKGTSSVKTKILSYTIKEAPSYDFNTDYNIYNNYGYFYAANYGYSNLKITKFQFINDGKVIYTHSPKNWILIGRKYQTFYFYPKKTISNFSYNTYIKVYFTYDGIKHSTYLYR